MKKFILLFFITFLFSAQANAAIIWYADSPSCGPYPYQKVKNGPYYKLPVLSANSVSQGSYIRAENERLNTFIRGWMDFFNGNGDRHLMFKSLCIGFFDDERSTGPNALAYGTEAILTGTKMMRNIMSDVDAIITKT